MKALIVINGYFENPNNTYKIKRLKEEFLPYGIQCEVKDALSLLPCCEGDTIDLDLSQYSFAIDMDKDIYLAKILSMSLPLFNSYDAMRLSDDKMLSILQLKKSGIKCPLTIPAPLCYVSNPDGNDVNDFLNFVEEKLAYPMVFKECHGSLGKQVFLIHDRSELEEMEKRYRFTQHFYEKFLAKHQGSDYRIIVIGDKVVACMNKINKKDFRSNIALGGMAVDVTDTIPQKYKDLALKATSCLHLDYAGIDVGIFDDDEPVFIEANGNAFFTEIEKVTKINVAKVLVKHIVSKLR